MKKVPLLLSFALLAACSSRSRSATPPPDEVRLTTSDVGGAPELLVQPPGGPSSGDVTATPGPVAPDPVTPGGIVPPSAAPVVSTTLSAPDFAHAPTVIGWNFAARGLVAATRTNPPRASRVYALLSVAQDHACELVARADPRLRADERAAIEAASRTVLAALFPDAVLPGVPAVGPGADLGHEAALGVLEEARGDRSDAVWTGTIPTGPGVWTGKNPLLPLWGSVRTWCLASGSELRPNPPPLPGSAEFLEALAEVRRISDTRTDEQLAIARFWADGVGTATPPGHWNEIACDLIARYRRDESRAAHTLAVLNMAAMDAGVSCWDCKYASWLIRPSQADPAITTPVGLPNFPSYTSGHSTFSGASATVLGAFFPGERQRLDAMAEEASVSRVYGGIHYRFDCETGLAMGRKIGELALASEGKR